MTYLLHVYRKNPSGILISPGPGESVLHDLCLLNKTLQIYRVEHSSFFRYTSRFRHIFASCFGAWTLYTFIRCLHGLTMHWGGFWRWVSLAIFMYFITILKLHDFAVLNQIFVETSFTTNFNFRCLVVIECFFYNSR